MSGIVAQTRDRRRSVLSASINSQLVGQVDPTNRFHAKSMDRLNYPLHTMCFDDLGSPGLRERDTVL